MYEREMRIWKQEHMENTMRRTNIYLIRIPEGESGHNEGKAIFKEIMATNVPELKNINPQTHDIQHIQSRINKVSS